MNHLVPYFLIDLSNTFLNGKYDAFKYYCLLSIFIVHGSKYYNLWICWLKQNWREWKSFWTNFFCYLVVSCLSFKEWLQLFFLSEKCLDVVIWCNRKCYSPNIASHVWVLFFYHDLRLLWTWHNVYFIISHLIKKLIRYV